PFVFLAARRHHHDHLHGILQRRMHAACPFHVLWRTLADVDPGMDSGIFKVCCQLRCEFCIWLAVVDIRCWLCFFPATRCDLYCAPAPHRRWPHQLLMCLSFAHPENCCPAIRTHAPGTRRSLARPDRLRVGHFDHVLTFYAVRFDNFFVLL